MAEGGFDDIELKEREREKEKERVREREREEETSFIEHEDHSHDGLLDGGKPSGKIPEVKRDVGVMRRAITNDKKNFFKNYLKIDIVKRDGQMSEKLLNRVSVRLNRFEKIVGLAYKGSLVYRVTVEGTAEEMVGSPRIDEFRNLFALAKEEHARGHYLGLSKQSTTSQQRLKL